ERPYFQYSSADLEEVLRSARGDRAVLRLLSDELRHRKTRAAVRLAKAVQQQLAAATGACGGPKVSTDPEAGQKCAQAGVRGLDTPARVHTRKGTIDSHDDHQPASGNMRVTEWNFDDAQLSVIQAHVSARLIVNAPPGTGKTAIACARVASLLGRGVPPHQIWV